MLAYFGLTLFVSALLLFLVQPMVGKMLLPRLGGTPAVWNTCMVFFQGILLAGYGYTHTLSTTQPRRRQLLVQLALLCSPIALLPFSPGLWEPPTESNPVFALLGLLLIMVGLPFLVVSTTAPLLQKWFAYTGHPAAQDPYFLYGASNLGSMLALVMYPTVIEPSFGVDEQARLWTAGYFLFSALVVGCVVLIWRAPAPIPVALDTHITTSVVANPALTWPRRLRWIGLAAAPSSLMLGVTTHMTTDIAAVPFFWIVPLALYLLTFILVFARWPVVWTEGPHNAVLYLQPCCVLLLTLQMTAHLTPRFYPTQAIFILHLLAFLTTTLVCHGELARDRPGLRHLTEFYLWMSVGGVLGGLFNALVAPVVFQKGVFEYPIALVLGYLLRPNLVTEGPLIPGDSSAERPRPLGWVLDAIVPVGLVGAVWFLLKNVAKLDNAATYWRPLALGFVVVGVFTMLMRPIRFALALAALLATVTYFDHHRYTYLVEARDFFTMIRVYDEPRATPAGYRVYRTLYHGGIEHGHEIVEPAWLRRRTITYFHPANGVSDIFAGFAWSDARLPAALVGMGPDPFALLVGMHSEPPYAVLGLGTGALAGHARPFQHVDFYEIDPLVRDLSLPAPGKEPIFYYLRDALDRGADLRVIMGDGRLKLKEHGPRHYYHVIALDAFSSDAIPVHLLTAEAIDLYLERLAEGGVLLFNATNRYVDISPVLSAIAESRNLECLLCSDPAQEGAEDQYTADWVVLRRKGPAGNGGPPLDQRLSPERWKAVDPLDGPIWTDNYSNLFRVLTGS